MSALKFESLDERTGKIMVGAGAIEVEQFGKWLVESGQSGYVLQGASGIEGGSQRDPSTIGLRVVLRREGS